jgi:hypothetical protein
MTMEVDAMPWITVHCADGDDWQATLKHILEEPDSFEVLEVEDMFLVRATVDPESRKRERARARKRRQRARDVTVERDISPPDVTPMSRFEVVENGGVTGDVTQKAEAFCRDSPPCHALPELENERDERDERDRDERDSVTSESLMPTEEEAAVARAAIAARRAEWVADGKDPYAHRRLRRRT